MSLRMSKAQAQKYLQKQKPNTFITLRREQFEFLEVRLKELAVDRQYYPTCRLCGNTNAIKGATSVAHKFHCPVYLISKLEKV